MQVYEHFTKSEAARRILKDAKDKKSPRVGLVFLRSFCCAALLCLAMLAVSRQTSTPGPR